MAVAAASQRAGGTSRIARADELGGQRWRRLADPSRPATDSTSRLA